MKSSFSDRLKYKFDNYLSKGTLSMISGLAILSVILMIVFGGILLVLGIHPNHKIQDNEFNFFQSIWVSLIHMIDPGTVGGHEDNWSFQLFMLLVTLFGLVIVSTLIGLISNGILTKLEMLRKGRSFIMENDHVLLLGWSSKIFTIIPEIMEANENQKNGIIVILADMDKVEMEDEIKDKIGNTGNTKVICRTGNPIDIHDLEITNPYQSKSIIILDKDNEDSDSQIIKTIVAIVTNPKRRTSPYHITAEMTNEKNLDVAKMVGGDEVELILSNQIISRIMVQTSRQSGLSIVYQDLMDFQGDEIYFDEAPELVGKTFKEALFAYEDSAVIGIQYADKSVAINPRMDTVIQKGDFIIGITEDDDTLIPNTKEDPIINENSIVYSIPKKVKNEKILIIGWNDRARYILYEINHYVPEGTSVEIVSKFDDQKDIIENINKETTKIEITFTKKDTTDKETLENMKLEKYDYIMLLCYENYFSIQEADAQTLITLLHLRNFTEKFGFEYRIVSEMLDVRNRQLADITSADDFIVSDKLLSLLMSQVSENKYLMRVFEDLFDADGSEIYIKPATDYVHVGTDPLNFNTILAAASRKNEIAIGYRNIKYSKNSEKQYGVVLNPKKSEMFTLDRNDTIIVLSED